jgi:hypothetical protein
MSSSKKIDLYRDFAAGIYLSQAQKPHTSPPYTLYIYVHSELEFLKTLWGLGTE